MSLIATGRRNDEDRSAMSRLRWYLIASVILLATWRTSDGRRMSACRDQSELEFNDVASLTVLSSAVFDGRPVQSDSDDDVVEFRVGRTYKGAELFPDGLERSSTASVRLSSTRCARSLRGRRRRFLVFLNGSRADGVVDDRPPVHWSLTVPVRFSKRSVKIARKHSCSDCASSPRSAQLTPSAVYGRFGHPLDLNCRASRNTKPPPRVTWFKDGVAVVISDRLQIDSTRRGATLLIREARLNDSGTYSCHVTNVIGSAVSAANHVTIAEPVPPSKPHSRLCNVQYYCLNYGTCYVLIPINRTYCECLHPYSGPRCQDVRLDESMYSASVVDNPLVIGGLLVAGFAMLMLLIATAYFVIKHYNEFKRHQTQSQPNIIATHVNGTLAKGRPGRQCSRATQTGNPDGSLDRPVPLPYVVVTAPSPDDRRPEPTLMRHVWSPPAAVTAGARGRGRLRLSAVSNTPDSVTPDYDGDTSARLLPSDGDHDDVEGRQDGRTSNAADRLGNGQVTTADSTGSDDSDTRRRDEEAEMHALLRDLGVEPSSVNK